jgi:glycosyltransferase involved in cell wall biosynthesis
MKITITTPAKFPAAFVSAGYLDARGELERIISPVPPARSRHFGVAASRTTGLTPLGAWNYAFQHWGPRALQPHHQAAFSAAFDEAAARLIGDCDIVNPWCSTALRTIRAAHRRGIPAVLEVASAHLLAQRDLIEEEYARFGADVERAVFSQSVIDRTLAEYDEADAIIVTSSFVRETFTRHGVPAAKIHVVPYGIDAAPAPRAEGSGPLRVLFVGGCSLRKGIPYLLDAFRRIDTDATLRLVGRENAPLFARLGGLPPRVTAVGVKAGAALAAEYAAADVFVLPSVEDGFGLVTLEAMAAGVPVVVSANAGSAEVVRDGENGFVVSARDITALSDRIASLLADASLRQRMGESARRTAAARSWETYGDERNERVFRPLPGAFAERKVTSAAAA